MGSRLSGGHGTCRTLLVVAVADNPQAIQVLHVGYESQCACFCDHHFRIAAITRHASDNGVLAICRVTATTGLAGSVFTSKEPDSYTLAYLPGRNPPANLLDAANCFMARHTRIHDAGQLSLNGTRV
jgi:hypothetical protein